MSGKKIPKELQPWIEAKKKHRLSQMHVQMARELGMNPKKFGKLDNHKQEQWKAPLPQFIENLYMKRFGKEAPSVVLSFEQITKLKMQKKAAANERKALKKVGASTEIEEQKQNNSDMLQVNMPNDSHSIFMKQAIEFAQMTNPIWPFGAILVDANGKILCKAADCAFISPLFHAEALVIHALITAKPFEKHGKLTLYATCEPDTLSLSAIYWAKKAHDLQIEKIVYGTTLKTIKKMWRFGIDIKAKELINRSYQPSIVLKGPFMENECNQLFIEAKERQAKINSPHPSRGYLPNNLEAFYKIY